MAAINWTQLQQACAIALTRQLGTSISTYDTLFTTMFPFATSYAEDRINQELALVGNRRTVTASVTGPFLAWSDFDLLGATLTVPEQLYVLVNNSNVSYDAVSFDFIERVWPNFSSTLPPSPTYQGGCYWAVRDGTTLVIAPTPAGTYSAQLTGLYTPVPISSGNSTTYLSTNYPDLLTAGCLVYLAGALTRNYGAQADEPRQAVSWESQFQTLLSAARDEERRRRGLRPDVPSPPPPPMAPGA